MKTHFLLFVRSHLSCPYSHPAFPESRTYSRALSHWWISVWEVQLWLNPFDVFWCRSYSDYGPVGTSSPIGMVCLLAGRLLRWHILVLDVSLTGALQVFSGVYLNVMSFYQMFSTYCSISCHLYVLSGLQCEHRSVHIFLCNCSLFTSYRIYLTPFSG